MHTVARTFNDSIQKYLTARTLVDRITKEPPGVRPFASPDTVTEFDEGWSHSPEDQFTISVVVPKGATRRQAMKLVHHAATLHAREVSLEAKAMRLQNLASAFVRRALFDACSVWEEKHVDPLGLEDGKKVLPNKKLAQDFVEKLFAGIVAKTRAAKAAEKEREEARIKKEEELAKTLSIKDPGVLMRDLVKEVAREEKSLTDEAITTCRATKRRWGSDRENNAPAWERCPEGESQGQSHRKGHGQGKGQARGRQRTVAPAEAAEAGA